MKRLSIVYTLLFLLFGCEKEETMVVMKETIAPPQITSPLNSADITITAAELADDIEFTWNETDYGVNTEVNYTLQMVAGCNSFTNPVTIISTTSNSWSMTLGDFNSKLVNDLKIAPHQKSDVQLRVSSSINDRYPSTSEIISISVTPWSDKPVALWMGENSASVPIVFANGEHTYEGYRYLEEGASFRFSNNPVCADIVYGSSGASLVEGDASTEIGIATSGFYKVNVDTENLTYELMLIETWGMIGTATPNGWDSSTPLTYNADNDVWQADITLAAGALKFRANNGWDLNYGPAVIDDLDGLLTTTNDAINIAEPGNYRVTIDFTQAEAPYSYKYSVSKLSDVPEPAKLWLPGSYQGWSPATAPTIYAINGDTYEGYVYINNGAGFKFTSAPDWDHINYGDSGTPGLLTTDGLADGMTLSTAGYYKFKVNTTTLAYTIDLITTWGLIGTSTTGGWDNSTAMTYDQANGVWKITTDLVPGALKFRANNGWGINYGAGDINAFNGTLVFDAPSVNIAEAGSYTVILDFSRSESPYQFTYSITKN